LLRGDTAIEQSVFTIRSTPKAGGAPVIFKGRAMVVYVRYAKSPTGWASLREMIQPATE
jgi:ketosteroid isomerase-like protein